MHDSRKKNTSDTKRSPCQARPIAGPVHRSTTGSTWQRISLAPSPRPSRSRRGGAVVGHAPQQVEVARRRRLRGSSTVINKRRRGPRQQREDAAQSARCRSPLTALSCFGRDTARCARPDRRSSTCDGVVSEISAMRILRAPVPVIGQVETRRDDVLLIRDVPPITPARGRRGRILSATSSAAAVPSWRADGGHRLPRHRRLACDRHEQPWLIEPPGPWSTWSRRSDEVGATHAAPQHSAPHARPYRPPTAAGRYCAAGSPARRGGPLRGLDGLRVARDVTADLPACVCGSTMVIADAPAPSPGWYDHVRRVGRARSCRTESTWPNSLVACR